jgi:hypothetical protein
MCDAPLKVVPCLLCCVQGTLPASWVNLTMLVQFECANCSLSGQLPNWGSPDAPNCVNASAMAMFNVSHNQLIGTVPDSYGAWRWLRVLDVGHNNLTAGLTEPPVCGWTQLQVLRAAHNSFTTMFYGALCGTSGATGVGAANLRDLGGRRGPITPLSCGLCPRSCAAPAKPADGGHQPQ